MKLGLLAACLVSVAAALHFNAPQDEHRRWLDERYKEAVSIKPGMTRADLHRLFSVDGGLQTIPDSRYVLKSCGMIKVEVKFDVPQGLSRESLIDENAAADEALKIIEVSKPYLEYPAVD
jgi:hypothetical protein